GPRGLAHEAARVGRVPRVLDLGRARARVRLADLDGRAVRGAHWEWRRRCLGDDRTRCRGDTREQRAPGPNGYWVLPPGLGAWLVHHPVHRLFRHLTSSDSRPGAYVASRVPERNTADGTHLPASGGSTPGKVFDYS